MSEALAEFKRQLALPMASDYQHVSVGNFNPWEALPCFYGSYSSDFDDVALTVLTNLLHVSFDSEALPHEMFREVLCNYDLCDYGLSPRVCFPYPEFYEILPELIARWGEYRKMMWGD